MQGFQRHGDSPVVDGGMDEFDRQLGAELRRSHVGSGRVSAVGGAAAGGGASAIKQPSATAGLRIGGKAAGTPAGSNSNTPSGGLSTPLGNGSNSVSASNTPSSSTGGASASGVDPELAAALGNKLLTRQMKYDIAKLVLRQSGAASAAPLTDDVVNKIVSALATELSQVQSKPRSGSKVLSPTVEEGRATIDSELLWSEVRDVPQGAVVERPNAPQDDVGLGVLYDKDRAQRVGKMGGSDGLNIKVTPTAVPGPIKPRPQISTRNTGIKLNPNMPIAQHQHRKNNALRGESTVTRSVSSAFSECSTSSYGSLHSSIVSHNK